MLPPVLQWDSSTNEYSSRGAWHPKYWPWYFATFIFGTGSGVAGCIYSLFHSKQLELVNFTFQIILVPLGLSLLLPTAVVCRYVKDVVLAFKRMNYILRELGKNFYKILKQRLCFIVVILQKYLIFPEVLSTVTRRNLRTTFSKR